MAILRTILVLVIITSSISCTKKHSIPTVGEKISNYDFSDIINGQSTSIKELIGKPIILEFWATWCGACIPAIKKLDSLQSKYSNDLEIITVSSDDRERLEKFIKTTNINLRVSFDTLHQEVFPYKTIPHSILINKNGIVRAITSPRNITEQTIINLIADKPLGLKEKKDFIIDTSNVKTLVHISDVEKNLILKNHNPKKRSTFKANYLPDGSINRIEYHNLTIPSIFQSLYEVRSNKRVKFLDNISSTDFEYIPENLYNLTIEVSKEIESNIYQIGQEFLNNNFDINAKKTIDTTDVFILIKTSDKLKESTTTGTPQNSSVGPIFVSKKLPLKSLISYLENHSSLPVVDKTGLTNKYDITLNWQLENPSTLHSELKKYGLQLIKSDKPLPIEVLKIYKKRK